MSDEDVGGGIGWGIEDGEGEFGAWAMDLDIVAFAVEDDGQSDFFGIVDNLKNLDEVGTGLVEA